MLFGQQSFASQMWNLLKQLMWSIHMQRCRSQNLLKVYSTKPYDSSMMTDLFCGVVGAFLGFFLLSNTKKNRNTHASLS